MNKPEEHKLYQAPNANTFTFHSMNAGWVMRITAEGRIEVADGADVTEAAQKVLDAMQSMLDVGLEKAVLAEREACALIAETPICGEQDDITMEAKDRVAAAIRARTGEQK
jgi:hypothetical protein